MSGAVLLSRYQDFMLRRRATGQEEEPEFPPVVVDDYFKRAVNQVIRSEVKFPSKTSSNLVFTGGDFATINTKKAAYTADWNELLSIGSAPGDSPGDDAVSVAIDGCVTNNSTKKASAFNKMVTALSAEISSQTSYTERSKNAFCLLWAAYMVYDWCKNSVTATARSNYRSKCHTLFNRGPDGINIDPLLHKVRVSGHPTTFYEQQEWKAIAFYLDEPIYFNHLLDDKFSGDGREVIDYFVKSGMSKDGTYSSPKVSGLIGMEMAWKHLIPAGKTFYHPHIKFLPYDYLYRFGINRIPSEDGEYNDEWYKATVNNATGAPTDFKLYLYWTETMFRAHAIHYQDPIIVKAIEDLDNLSLYQYDKFVIRPLYLAAKILYDLDSAGNYNDLPKVKRASDPVSSTLYVSKFDFTPAGGSWSFGDRDTERYFSYELDMNESFVNAHDPNRMGSIQIRGMGGHKLTGSTGAFSGTHSKHSFNWQLWALGNNILRVIDNRDTGWKNLFKTDRIQNHGGPHYPFNDDFNPINLANYNNSNRGKWAKKVSRSCNDVNMPTYIYDCVDLTSCYAGYSTTFRKRLDSYTRSVMAFPLNTGGVSSVYDGIIFVLDRFVVTDPNNDYFLQWQLFQSPITDTDNNKCSARGANGNGTATGNGKLHILTMPTTQITMKTPTGWEGYPPSNVKPVPESGKGDRLEVRPYGASSVNYFLTALVVGHNQDPTADSGPELADFSYLKSGNTLRVQFENKVWISHTDDTLIDSVGFDVVGTGTKDIVVTSLDAAGSLGAATVANYAVNGGSGIAVNPEENTLFFTGSAGSFSVVKA